MRLDPNRYTVLQAHAAASERAVQAAIEALNKASHDLSEARSMDYGPAAVAAAERAYVHAKAAVESARALRDGAQSNANAARRVLGIARF